MLNQPITTEAAYNYLTSLRLIQASSVKAGIKNLAQNVRFKDSNLGQRPVDTVTNVENVEKAESYLDDIVEALKGEED